MRFFQTGLSRADIAGDATSPNREIQLFAAAPAGDRFGGLDSEVVRQFIRTDRVPMRRVARSVERSGVFFKRCEDSPRRVADFEACAKSWRPRAVADQET